MHTKQNKGRTVAAKARQVTRSRSWQGEQRGGGELAAGDAYNTTQYEGTLKYGKTETDVGEGGGGRGGGARAELAARAELLEMRSLFFLTASGCRT